MEKSTRHVAFTFRVRDGQPGHFKLENSPVIAEGSLFQYIIAELSSLYKMHPEIVTLKHFARKLGVDAKIKFASPSSSIHSLVSLSCSNIYSIFVTPPLIPHSPYSCTQI